MFRPLAAFMVLAFGLFSSPQAAGAQVHDPQAPCGRDENGIPYVCVQDPAANIEAACLTRADPSVCLPYHQRACQIQGIAAACRIYGIGTNCAPGGDPNACAYYAQLLTANRDCALNSYQPACQWLYGQGF